MSADFACVIASYERKKSFNLAFLLTELLVIQYTKSPFKYLRPIIFTNLPRSRNSQNKGHAKILGFTVFDSIRYEKKTLFAQH